MLDLELLAEDLGRLLVDRGEMLAVAESCTGGWVAETVTAIPGSSAWFDCGFVTYSNAAKMEMLGVAETTLAHHGAVAEQTARAMAQGVIAHSRADWSVATTGIAGPSGATPGKPVGMVCFAWARRDGGCEAQTCHFSGNRTEIRAQAVRHALNGLIERIDSAPVVA